MQHVLHFGDYAAVVTSVGASLRSLTFRGRNLVVPFEADQLRPAYRGATLAPWPNRVVHGRYRFDGAEYQLPLTEPERSHALHGLVRLGRVRTGRRRRHRTSRCATTIEPQAGYPWRVRVESTYELDADGLVQTVSRDQHELEASTVGHRSASVPGRRSRSPRLLDPRAAR